MNVMFIVDLNTVKSKLNWTRRDLNTQPSDLESDALPLRHEFLFPSNKQ